MIADETIGRSRDEEGEKAKATTILTKKMAVGKMTMKKMTIVLSIPTKLMADWKMAMRRMP